MDKQTNGRTSFHMAFSLLAQKKRKNIFSESILNHKAQFPFKKKFHGNLNEAISLHRLKRTSP